MRPQVYAVVAAILLSGALIAAAIAVVGSGVLYRYYAPEFLVTFDSASNRNDTTRWLMAQANGCEPMAPPARGLATLRCPIWVTP